MENRKNLCAMISGPLYAKVVEEKEQLGLTLSQYVEQILKEHFEGGKTMVKATRTLAFQVSEELFMRIKEHLKTGLSQKDFVIGLIEKALEEAEEKETREEAEEEPPEGLQEGPMEELRDELLKEPPEEPWEETPEEPWEEPEEEPLQ